NLHQHGILLQANAEYFTRRLTQRAAIKALKNGEIYLLGSDCHNMNARKPNMGDAADIIKRKLGDCVLGGLNCHGWEAFNEMD
ncbi:MAG: hypothetical protein PHE09_05435, partial [Oscillospiraceae bacterium]|nr:hypothetical protein [Oscillospiraceae bacterium]